jgi:hypothetical protein
MAGMTAAGLETPCVYCGQAWEGVPTMEQVVAHLEECSAPRPDCACDRRTGLAKGILCRACADAAVRIVNQVVAALLDETVMCPWCDCCTLPACDDKCYDYCPCVGEVQVRALPGQEFLD